MSDSTAIEAFNSNRAAELLRDKVRAAFVELIPEDEWKRMIKAESVAFFEKRTVKKSRGGFYSNSFDEVEEPSEFSKVCREELRAFFNAEENKDFRRMVKDEMRAVVLAELEDRLPAVVREMAADTFKSALDWVKNQIANEIANRV